LIRGFDPIARADARVLVLGTIPGERSLAEGRYYAHPMNAFWRIMRRLFSAEEDLDHAGCTEMLMGSHVALWDVLHAGERPGSLDSAIVAASALPNDIASFLELHPEIHAIFFNGATAERLFRDRIAPSLPPARDIMTRRLPSTSPANAALTFEEKLDAWRVVATEARRER